VVERLPPAAVAPVVQAPLRDQRMLVRPVRQLERVPVALLAAAAVDVAAAVLLVAADAEPQRRG
jgi:hypothetical protein